MTGLREDAAGLLELVRPGVELLVSTSFSKTFSLYAERVGAMLVIAASAADAAAVQSHVKAAIRTNYSNPPAHGADIVRTILADADLRPRWEAELAAMRDRIKANRRALVSALEARSIPGDWGGNRRRSAGCSRCSGCRRTRSPDSATSTRSTWSAMAGSTSPASPPSNLDPFADALGAGARLVLGDEAGCRSSRSPAKATRSVGGGHRPSEADESARPRSPCLGDEPDRPRSILAQTSAGPGQVAAPVIASRASRGSAG